MIIAAEAMAQVAREVLSMPNRNKKAEDKTFRGFFGAPISIITDIWNKLALEQNLEDAAKPKHLLWSLVFLKVYSTEEVHCRIVGWPDPKTYRKWSCWYFLEQISGLQAQTIKLSNRFRLYDGTTSCLMSVDGTDCPVFEPWPFDPKWYSQKFNGPGIKYEVAVCIKSGDIVWINGPFECSKNDGTIFCEGLALLLAEDEGVECDSGYMGHKAMKNNNVNNSRLQRREKNVVRARHETVNARLKVFNILNVPFRHSNPRDAMMQKHGVCFKAIAVITQLKFEAGEKSFDVKYTTNYF